MSDMKVTSLQYFDEDKKGIKCDSLNFIQGHGIENDRHAGAGDKQVTIASVETLKEIGERPTGGLCFRRYRCNVTVDGFTNQGLEIGSKIRIGETELEVTGFKECFPDTCGLAKSGGRCPIKASSVYAKITKGGTVKLGDEVETWR